jgi:hypothetical protein
MAHLIEVDNFTSAWLRAKADAVHKTPAEIISDMVQREIAAAP